MVVLRTRTAVCEAHVVACEMVEAPGHKQHRSGSSSDALAASASDGMDCALRMHSSADHTYSAKVVGLFGHPPGVCSNATPITILDEDVVIAREPCRPSIRFSQKVKDQLYQPWANDLIIKLMGDVTLLSLLSPEAQAKMVHA